MKRLEALRLSAEMGGEALKIRNSTQGGQQTEERYDSTHTLPRDDSRNVPYPEEKRSTHAKRNRTNITIIAPTTRLSDKLESSLYEGVGAGGEPRGSGMSGTLGYQKGTKRYA